MPLFKPLIQSERKETRNERSIDRFARPNARTRSRFGLWRPGLFVDRGVGCGGCWKVFVKAGQPGWGILIPIFNVYLMIKIAGRPGWYLILMFIPLINIVVSVLISIDIARNFGKGIGFAIGLFFLGFIFYPILGFGDARYQPVAH